jgi:hypothetical protein
MYEATEEQLNLLDQTFDIEAEQLPTISQIKDHIAFDIFDIKHAGDSITTATFRMNHYCKHSFVLLTHEWMTELVKFLSKYNKVSELSCGAGWISHWAQKYGKPIEGGIVDNKSWNCTKTISCLEYQDWVEKRDSVDHVLDTPDVDLYILSWPYMDNVAARIWSAMKKGQSLLYIGEDAGGCTANDDFFEMVYKHEVPEIWETRLVNDFRSFFGVRDRPVLYVK